MESYKDYAVIGYDKDHDIYDALLETNDLENAIIQATLFSHVTELSDCLKSSCGDPFDWFKVVNVHCNDIIYWTSYSGSQEFHTYYVEFGGTVELKATSEQEAEILMQYLIKYRPRIIMDNISGIVAREAE